MQVLLKMLIDLRLPEGSTVLCNITSSVVDTASNKLWAPDFLSSAAPLCFMAESLTKLSFTAANWTFMEGIRYNFQTVSESWACFRAISKLKKLKHLILHRTLWERHTKSDVEVANPLAEIPRLEVRELQSLSLIAYVEGGRLNLK